MLYVANPITFLWADLVEQGLTHNPKDAIYVPDLLEVLQRALVLLGNANHHISEISRENALESIHPSLKKYGRGDFTQAKGAVFGEVFKDELVKKVRQILPCLRLSILSPRTPLKRIRIIPGLVSFFRAGSVGMELCPAGTTIRTNPKAKEGSIQTDPSTKSLRSSVDRATGGLQPVRTANNTNIIPRIPDRLHPDEIRAAISQGPAGDQENVQAMAH